jgi:PAS domain S-box-containing protein
MDGRLAQLALDHVADGVLCTDAQGLVTYLNAEAERLTGWTFSAAAGRSVQLIFSVSQGEHQAPTGHPLLWADAPRSQTHSPLPEGCVLVSRLGHEFLIEGSAAPLIANGTLAGAVAIFRSSSDSAGATMRRSSRQLQPT